MVNERHGQRYLRRLHQEDFCQALGRFPAEKYEKDGGPGWVECFALMDLTEDPFTARSELLQRAIFQYLIGNPDAHAKNYALVYKNDRLALSKLYDVNNAAAFRARYKEQRPRLAMFVGGTRNPDDLSPGHWRQFSQDIGIRWEIVRDRLAAMARDLPRTGAEVRHSMAGTLADTDLLDLALDDVSRRCKTTSETLNI